jgi:hypothetical protein
MGFEYDKQPWNTLKVTSDTKIIVYPLPSLTPDMILIN